MEKKKKLNVVGILIAIALLLLYAAVQTMDAASVEKPEHFFQRTTN